MYYLIFGFGLIAFLPFLFIIIVGSAIVVAHYTRNYVILVYAQLSCITWISAFIQWTIGSMDQSGLVIVWSFLGPLGALIFLTRRQAVLWMLMFLFIVVISAVFEPALLGYKPIVAASHRIMFYIMNIVTASSVVFASSFWFIKTIQDEKKHSDALLLNILPKEVADELKQKGYADSKHFDNVTVMFTDFKNFTQICETLTPTEMVAEIDYCFKTFDNIISNHNIEKIKTIGDSYMCAGGLPVNNMTHAEDIVRAAIEIQQFMQEHLQARKGEGKEPFEIRIGIHTGPVVAGIVGVKKFAYDIWGDTVNIASRMESSGEAGKINISGSTYELVKDVFSCIGRGKIQAKNKGEIEMYFVNGKV